MEKMEKISNLEMFKGSPIEVFSGSPTQILSGSATEVFSVNQVLQTVEPDHYFLQVGVSQAYLQRQNNF